jgi:hypothetical protein
VDSEGTDPVDRLKALRFVDDCERMGLTIIGLDFYVIEGESIIEVNSTDWSSITEGSDAFERSIDH